MAYIGQPIPSTVTHISSLKVSDGKSVNVTVPSGTAIEAGKFYQFSGFFGAVLKTVTAAQNTAGVEVALQLEPCEYVTDQIDTTKTFSKGSELYFDTTNGVFTDTRAAGLLVVGKVSEAKDEANTIQFIRYPQITTVPAAATGGTE